MSKYTTVVINADMLQTILESAKHVYPRETILLLRGAKKKEVVAITDILIPPLATYGQGFAHLPLHMLPMDFSIVGTAHSHPSGNSTPSDADMNHFFGYILMIVGFPYTNERNVAIYNHDGERLTLQMTNP